MSETPKCQWCGLIHGPRCPTVKAIEYHPDGTVKRVEFMTPVDHRPIDWANIRIGAPSAVGGSIRHFGGGDPWSANTVPSAEGRRLAEVRANHAP